MKTLFTIIAIAVSLIALGQTAQEHYSNGNEKAAAKDFASSIKDFDKAIKLDSKYTDAYYNRGTSKLHLNDYKGALADYNKAIDLKPDFMNAYTNRGVVKLKLQDIKGAIKDFDEALKLDPSNASAYYMRGQVKLQTGNTNAGCEDLSKAKELGDNRAEKYIQQYCKGQPAAENKTTESLLLDWPDTEGWKIANRTEDAEEKTIELLKHKETFDNWTEIGTMFVYKNIPASKKIPITKTMDLMYDGAKKICPSPKATMLDKDETANHPWIIFKIECSSNTPEAQVWYAIQGTNELFVNFRGVKQKIVPADLQNKWIKFFKSAKIVAN